MAAEEFLAGLKALEEVAPGNVIEELVRLFELMSRRVWLQLPPIPIVLEYNVDIELPREFAVLAGLDYEEHDNWLSARVAKVEVMVAVDGCRRPSLEVAVKDGEGDTLFHIETATLGQLAALYLLWRLLKQHHGIDFLADLKAKLEERRDWLLQLKNWLDDLAGTSLLHPEVEQE